MLKSTLRRAAALVTAACGLIAAGAGTAAAARPAVTTATVTIATRSALRPVDGHTLVVFRGAGQSRVAAVSGRVTRAQPGDQITLLARPFGAASYAPAARPITIGSGHAARYSFIVRPGLATSYQVRVIAGSRVAGRSPARTVYVVPHGAVTGSPACSRPVCHLKFRVWVKVPAPAYRAETAKHWYLYSRLFLSPNREPAPPKLLKLDHTATASRPVRVDAFQFVVTLRYTFRIGQHDGYRWGIDFCTQDSVATDGLGLPGRHGCGRTWISANPRYLG